MEKSKETILLAKVFGKIINSVALHLINHEVLVILKEYNNTEKEKCCKIF